MRGSAVCSFQSALGSHLMNSSAAVPMIDFPRIVRYFVLFVFVFFRPIDFPPNKSLMSTLFSPLLLLIASSLWFPISGTGATKFFGIFLFAFLLWIIAKGSSAVVHKLSSRLLSILFRCCCCCSSLFNHLFPTIHMTQLESRAHTLPVLSLSLIPFSRINKTLFSLARPWGMHQRTFWRSLSYWSLTLDVQQSGNCVMSGDEGAEKASEKRQRERENDKKFRELGLCRAVSSSSLTI